ncbi:hypothetical protein PP7435_CHR1-1013 [Komagataella phaffii CBS 7435]|uniref:Uncharacterized protein n=2 Tax=Komagataella phaffii TaxID=460519 RepID=C4QXU4_KOMPG|nr:Plasma membrane protein of unknown function [Komagataella phaffii GS115]AOA61552.1 GQ67_01943T0 [Komagataella phaffii]CAH2446885.1 hypothetical protein BQ9382_C1-5335 [Komagataella phaffii CBS 7435]AOA65935.1 GQ68_01958T0 [Komagataella phaffii GS115]CAY68067.1 Plasma membrane protein of unknown function [Komagataella phaffii GS115]CCA37143.1 hypothetical protein PP7435_CHR1-1013 [Komagataella phaffii CBS 7435]
MKFGQTLNDDLVPEWKSQYFDYKQGKKKLKKLYKNYVLNREKLKGAETQLPTQLNSSLPTVSQNSSQSKPNLPFSKLPPPAIESHSGAEQPDQQDKRVVTDTTPLLEPIAYTPQNQAASSTRRKSFIERLANISGISGNSSPNFNPDFDVALQNLEQDSNNEFMEWIDDEFDKINTFYKRKETKYLSRLLVLQDQVAQLRQQKYKNKQRISAIRNQLDDKPIQDPRFGAYRLAFYLDTFAFHVRKKISEINHFEFPSLPSWDWVKGERTEKQYYEEEDDDEYDDAVDSTEDDYESNAQVNENAIDDVTDSSNEESSNAAANPRRLKGPQDPHYNKQDYGKRKKPKIVPYFVARRQIKTAMLELYRGLEILKSYRLLNRTAFRKMIKKYDKTMNTQELPAFMVKIDEAYFNKSDVLDNIMQALEALYAKTFEHGNRKVAISKLRQSETPRSYNMQVFFSSLLLGMTIPLLIDAIYTAAYKTITRELLEGKFMMQIWGGFLLISLMGLLIGINCMTWSKYKVNYKFIFEFTKDALDYRQYLVFPSLFLFMVAIFGWLSFRNFWPDQIAGRDWPWFLVSFGLFIIFCPFNIFYASARRWLLIGLWRLIWSGFYPVEFQDFFLGDIFCSLTYTLGNISFYICLYSSKWKGALDGTDSTTCGSSHSRVMGFLASLPSIWRLLQCFRRFADTGDWFPHLANLAKYALSTFYNMTLSIYRIEPTMSNRAMFITFATVNSVGCSFWDVFMDWSLMQANSKHIFLRDDLIFKEPAIYYGAVVLNTLLRFQWIFYALFSEQIQQSAFTSFFIALAEIFRRFVWMFFRMENEHCTNVHLFRASRETPLPYPTIKRKVREPAPIVTIPRKASDIESHRTTAISRKMSTATRAKSTTSTEGAPLSRTQTLRPMLEHVSKLMNEAHIKDFQRKKVDHTKSESLSDEDEDEEDENDTEEDLMEEEVQESLRSQ